MKNEELKFDDMNPQITKLIEQYLNDELSANDRVAFEKKMAENEMLRKEVEFQRQIHEAAKRLSLRSEIKGTAKRYYLLQKVMIAGVFILVLAIGSAVFYFSSKDKSTELLGNEKNEIIAQLEKLAPIEHLKTTYFEWSGKDTVFVSPNGVLLSVPKNAYLLDGKAYNGKMLLQYQEAVNVQDIVKSGLSTQSGNKLLETQGMFSVQAFTPDKKRLDVNPQVGVYVQVPVNELKDGMMLFEGNKLQNGIIDWQNPRKLQKMPVLADMKDLNFYPVGYEDTLNKLKLRKDKKYRDSLYLSMEEYMSGLQMYYPILDSEYSWMGAELFESKCVTCHSPHKDGTGPKLFEVRKKWAKGGAKPESIYTWVNNWQAAAFSDSYAKKASEWSPVSHMDYPELKKEDISAIFDYIDSQSLNDSASTFNGIMPSKVLSFWNPKFNNTILSTRDFEKRMRTIHKTCNGTVLKTYTDNLNLPLSEIDAKVAKMGYPEFETFASENIGAVDPSNPHIKMLKAYYETEIKALQKEVKDLLNVRLKKEQAWDNKTREERQKENARSADRNNKNFQQELDHNIESVYRQLGKKKPQLSSASVGFTITGNANIYNVDRFVMERTSTRTSGKFYDKETGKTARLTYNEMTLNVKDAASYNRVFVYLFPSKLSSYHRIEGKDGKFSYKLNAEFTYDLCIVGYKDDGYYFYSKKIIPATDLGTLTLGKISEIKLNASLEQMNNSRFVKTDPISDEIKWLIREKEDYSVQKLRQQMNAFRHRIGFIVFPCNMELPYDYLSSEESSEIEL
ncbi:MAG: c-type cytochrome [Bacteroidota bacterium]